MNKIAKFASISAIAMLVLMPVFVLAQLPTVSPHIVPGTDLAEIENILRRVAQFIIVFGIIVAVIFIILGGVKWMRAGGDQIKISEAKTQIWSGVWGSLVVLAVGLILQTLARVVTRVFFQ